MRLTNFYNVTLTKSNPSKNKVAHFALQQDTVSFSRKIDINYELKNLPCEAFLSEGHRAFLIEGLKNNPNADIVELHRQYYANLLNCKTLKEAKELYPEFKNLVDAKDFDISKKPSNDVFWRISKGEVENLKIETLTLDIAKKYYAQLIPINNYYIKENFNISYTAFKTILSRLNISMDKRYLKLIGLKLRAQNMSKSWENEVSKEKRKEALKRTTSSPQYKAKASLISKKRWENPQYREKMTQKIKEIRQDPNTRTKTAQITSQLWQDENYRKMMKINSIASSLAWQIHPNAKEIYKEVAHEFPELKEALQNKRKHLPLTERQERIIAIYHKTCSQRYPKFQKEVGQIQKELLEEWGFYKKDRNIDEILQYAESLIL